MQQMLIQSNHDRQLNRFTKNASLDAKAFHEFDSKVHFLLINFNSFYNMKNNEIKTKQHRKRSDQPAHATMNVEPILKNSCVFI